MAKKAKRKQVGQYRYDVKTNKKYQGRRYSVTMKGGQFTSKKDADTFYKKHPRATHIQRSTRKGNVSAGVYQPDAPSKIKRGKKTYRKTYVGPHTSREASKIQTDLRKKGFKTITKKTKHGTFVYIRD